ncbi:MAG: TonB-dependent receptor, partial [Sphingomonadales bacterium]|nr:TonB-dependent receptor [Sphingomonadales bacterium]
HMAHRNCARAASLLALAGGLLAMPAAAQQAPQAANPDDIVVTARRMEERLQDVPISITVFNQDQLAQRNIVNTTDLAAYTPGLSVNGRYGSDKSTFVIRGFSQELNTLPTVGVYFNDVVAPRLQSNIPSGNGAGVGAMFDLANVQVLKGPQGTLFGRNTTGGAILLVPKRPSDKLEGYVEGTLGNYNERRIEAVANIPLGDGFKIRLGIDRNKRDGYVHNRTAVGPADFNNVNYFAGRLGTLAELTPALENYTLFTYSHSNTHGTIGKFVYNNDGLHPGTDGSTGLAALLRTGIKAQVDRAAANGYGYYDVENNDPNPYVWSKNWQISNTTTWKAGDTLTVKNIASYGEAREKYSFNLDGDNTTFPFVLTYPGPTRTQGSQYTLTEELQLQGRSGDDRLTWQAGFYMERSAPLGSQEQWTQIASTCANVYAFQCSTLSSAISSVSVAKNNYRYHNYGLYAQATYKLADRLSVTGGIRNTWDWLREDADNVRVVPSPAGPLAYNCSRIYDANNRPVAVTADALGSGICTRSFQISSNRPTWLIDLDWKPVNDVLVYAKYARGYRGGGINEANLNAETWAPEKVNDYELGVKGSWHGPVSGSLAVDGFWNDFTNQQVTVVIPQCSPSGAAGRASCTRPAPTGINGIQNLGTSRMRGVEIEGSLSSGPVRLDVGYAYLDAKVLNAATPACDNSAFECASATYLQPGQALPFAPKNRITLTGTVTLPLNPKLGKVSLSATFTHTDQQITSYSNAKAFAAGAIPFDAGIAPATNLLNLNLNWKDVAGSPVDLALFATNVTKQKYFVSLTNSLASLGGESVILGEPRMFGVRLKVKYGK